MKFAKLLVVVPVDHTLDLRQAAEHLERILVERGTEQLPDGRICWEAIRVLRRRKARASILARRKKV